MQISFFVGWSKRYNLVNTLHVNCTYILQNVRRTSAISIESKRGSDGFQKAATDCSR